jgi:hypothetical protein
MSGICSDAKIYIIHKNQLRYKLKENRDEKNCYYDCFAGNGTAGSGGPGARRGSPPGEAEA